MIASEKLWMVSASRATEPVTTTMTTWMAAVTASPIREIFRARIPSALAVSADSIESAASWLWGENTPAMNPMTLRLP